MPQPSRDETPSGAFAVLKEVVGLAFDLPDTERLVAIGLMLIAVVTVAFIAVAKFLPTSSAIWVPATIVVVVVVIGALVAAYLVVGTTGEKDLRPRVGERLIVGVLSFAELGTAGDEEALGDGFAEELITRLSRIEELQVKPRHVMLSLKGRGLPTRKIASRLGAHYLVEGTLRRHDDDCRVSVGVIQTWDDDHWRDQWTGSFEDLFELQSDVAEGVAEHLLGSLRGEEASGLKSEERTAVRSNPASSVEANYAYMRGRANRRRFNNGREETHFRAAEKAFQEALDLDPDYVDGWAELGFLYLLRWETEGGSGWLERSAWAFRQVHEREPDHGVAMSELGYVALVEGRVDEAVRWVEEAARLHADETIPQNVRALLYMYLGFYETAVHLTETRVVGLDPDYVYPPTNACTCCLLMGRHDEASRWAERAKRIDPAAFVVWLVEGATLFAAGKLRAAQRAWKQGMSVAPSYIDPLFEVTLAWIDAARGDLDAARRSVADHRDDAWLRGAYDPYFISLCALAGEHELALDLIERQVTYAASYRYLLADATLRPLHEHPRFQDLLERRRLVWTDLVRRLDVPVPPPSLPAPGMPVPS